jgi:diguanylate cyclase (GGDEF)-like protein
MTNVFSRRAWFEHPPATFRSMAIVDVDHFKEINDRFGHPVGDVVLASVAERLTRAVGPLGTVGRVGGEEFGIAFHCEFERAVELCERCIEAFAEPVACPDEDPIGVTVSIGLAGRPAAVAVDGLIAHLYRIADRALYRAKAEGRNRLSVTAIAA